MADVLEWWPDYGGQLLWLRHGPGGTALPLTDLPLSRDTRLALSDWLSAYSDDKLPMDGPGDPAWMKQGIALLARCRAELRPGYAVVVTESWWGEPAADY